MEAIFHDWISLFLRWAHILAGIGWIGTSFYFMGLDGSLKKRKGQGDGIKGENWTVHGGGFYHIVKYNVAPEGMPDDLQWFKWEAYLTWLTGFGMLVIAYYWGAKGLLIDRAVLDLTVWQAIGISVASLVLGWIGYDLLCKSALKQWPVVMFAVLFAGLVAAAWGFQHVFSARAAWLHVGAVIGTMMTANVFLVIIPNSKIVVADLRAGRVPDAKYGAIAKLRSTHNNFLTLPVVLMMMSNHYPAAFGHPYSWVLIGAILLIGAVVRVWFYLHEGGSHGAVLLWQWPLAIVTAIGMMWFSSWRPDLVQAELDPVKALSIVATHCSGCHSATPTRANLKTAPGGIIYDNLDQIRAHAPKMIAQAVMSNAMPLGNETGMTQEERAVLGAWLRAGAPGD